MYQIAILDALGNKAGVLRSTLESRLRDLKIVPETDAEFLDENNLHRLRTDCRRVGVLFSDGPAALQFAAQVQILLDSPAVVLPAVSSLTDFSSKVPPALQATNGLELDPVDANLEKVAGFVLELLGLLRKRRRLFISYKRSESAAVAQQLYHALDERSFDVFLDTLSVRPADDFQEQLWHRMTDSDVVILLYTQSVHRSGWVEKEIDRAIGMKISVLQLIWPGVARDRKTELFEPWYLNPADFGVTPGDRVVESEILKICSMVESLRASSLARREAELVGTLRDRAEKQQMTTSVQPSRFVDLHCDAGTFVRVIPSVGVPDSEGLQACALAPVDGVHPKQVVLLYDSLNVTASWKAHLDWLSGYLPVRMLKVFELDPWLSTLCR
ncbi:MAG TPA: toll/interleukin-1 receptor domain-containing protein [Candidatus Dormibacteraeota bacterium]|nr:toll/interleukin-1 receptor domain-containing protein [Candidatus Dormibacteraeota bacterium]